MAKSCMTSPAAVLNEAGAASRRMLPPAITDRKRAPLPLSPTHAAGTTARAGSIDTDKYSDDYPEQDRAQPQRGVLVDCTGTAE